MWNMKNDIIPKQHQIAIYALWPDRATPLTFPYCVSMLCIISPSYSFLLFFWWFNQRRAIGHSCEQMLPRSLYVLPFRLYCQPAYPALMELLKSRYEQNLGGPAFVRACVPIRWEHGDKNLSNACRSCHSMHNNLGPCVCKKNTRRQERRPLEWGVLLINMYEVSRLSFLANLNDQYFTALCFKQRDKSGSCLYCQKLFTGW